VEGLAGVFRGGWGGVLVGLVVLRGGRVALGGSWRGGRGVQEGRREIYSTGSFWTHGMKNRSIALAFVVGSITVRYDGQI
jgi:hypothetical protein